MNLCGWYGSSERLSESLNGSVAGIDPDTIGGHFDDATGLGFTGGSLCDRLIVFDVAIREEFGLRDGIGGAVAEQKHASRHLNAFRTGKTGEVVHGLFGPTDHAQGGGGSARSRKASIGHDQRALKDFDGGFDGNVDLITVTVNRVSGLGYCTHF
jgi:hypothetical protein